MSAVAAPQAPAAEDLSQLFSPRVPSSVELRRIADEVRIWSRSLPNLALTELFVPSSRPTVRGVVARQSREYDATLDDAVLALDVALARDSAIAGIDMELRLFLAANSEQIASWTRGWERWSDA